MKSTWCRLTWLILILMSLGSSASYAVIVQDDSALSTSDADDATDSSSPGNDSSQYLPINATAPQCDPLEKMNRVIYGFNEVVDTFILKPVSELYIKIMPKPLAKGVSNMFNNIDTVPTVLNDILQANFYQAVSDTCRLAVNTTIGIGGFFDVASDIGLEPNTEDFGLTLARWGWTNSTYIVLPLMGPSTIRDGAIGFPVNYYALSVYPYIKPKSLEYGIYGLNVIVRRADLIHYQEVMDSIAIDKYVFMRDAYLQRRSYLVERNKQLSNPYLERSTEEYAAAKKEQVAQEQTRPFSSI